MPGPPSSSPRDPPRSHGSNAPRPGRRRGPSPARSSARAIASGTARDRPRSLCGLWLTSCNTAPSVHGFTMRWYGSWISGNGLSCRPKLPQLDAALVRRRAEPGAHVTERRRRRDRLRLADAGVGHLVAVERDAVRAQQPGAEPRLPLTEQLEVEVPDLLDALDPVVRWCLCVTNAVSARGSAAGAPMPPG